MMFYRILSVFIAFYRVLSLFIGGNARNWPEMARNSDECPRMFTKVCESPRKLPFASGKGKKAKLAKVIARETSLTAS